MAYITSRNDRFHVVAYDGRDPITGRERRKWHPAGKCRADAEAIAATLTDAKAVDTAEAARPTTFGRFLTEVWLPCRRAQLRPTTTRRYGWIIDNYIIPRLGDIPLRSLRAEHLDALYLHLSDRGGRDGHALAPKTVYDVHVVIRSGLTDAIRRHYITGNAAKSARPPRPNPRARTGPENMDRESTETLPRPRRSLSAGPRRYTSPRPPG